MLEILIDESLKAEQEYLDTLSDTPKSIYLANKREVSRLCDQIGQILDKAYAEKQAME